MRPIRKLSARQVLTGLILLSLVSCLLRPGGFGWPREMLAPVLAPLSSGLTHGAIGLKRNTRDLLGEPMDESTARDILATHEPLRLALKGYADQALRRTVAAQQWRLQQQQRQLAELEGWRQVFQSNPPFGCMLIPARVIGQGPTPFERTRRVRTQRKARAGSLVTTRSLLTGRPTALWGNPAVLADTALVGEVVASGAWTAQLRLVTDPGFHLRAFVHRRYDPARPRQITILQRRDGRDVPVERALGKDDPWVAINIHGDLDSIVSEEVAAWYGIAPGDDVVTMGDDARLPLGVFIGTVRDVQPVVDNPKHVALRITPAADQEGLDRVYIVLPTALEDR